jgi:hypothetical protein
MGSTDPVVQWTSEVLLTWRWEQIELPKYRVLFLNIWRYEKPKHPAELYSKIILYTLFQQGSFLLDTQSIN